MQIESLVIKNVHEIRYIDEGHYINSTFGIRKHKETNMQVLKELKK